MNTQHRRHQTYSKQKELDIQGLLNSHFVLLNFEYYTYFSEPYDTYLHKYFAAKLASIYNSNISSNWFKEFYFTKHNFPAIANLNTFISNKHLYSNMDLAKTDTITTRCLKYSPYNIIITNIPYNLNHEYLKLLASKCDNLTNFDLSLNCQRQYFQRTVILSFENSDQVEETIQQLESTNIHKLHFQPLIFKNMSFNETNFVTTSDDIKNIHKLLNKFYKYYNIPDKIPENCSLDFYILLLRVVFCYCYYCAEQFSSHILMAHCCGDYHIRSSASIIESRNLFDRKNKVFLLDIDYNLVKEMYVKGLTDCIVTDDGVYICEECKKEFQNMEFFCLHYQGKHFDVEKKEEFEQFVDNVDFILMGIVLGTHGRYLPWFIKNLEIEYSGMNETVYDMESVFSGNIDFNTNKPQNESIKENECINEDESVKPNEN